MMTVEKPNRVGSLNESFDSIFTYSIFRSIVDHNQID
jgi:hypothetical protein